VKDEVSILVISKPKNIVYSDNYQIIFDPKDLIIKEKIKVKTFLKRKFKI